MQASDDQEEEEVHAADDQEEEEVQADDDQEEEETQAANDQEEAQAAEAEWRRLKYRQQMRQQDQQTYDKTMKQTRGLFDFTQKTFITLPQYEEGTKFQFDISPAKLCDYLYNNTVSAEQVYTVLANTHNDYLVQLQATMKERFNRDFEPKHQPQMITYANFINNQVHKRTGSTTFWITLHPWSRFAWLWGPLLSAAPPDPPDPPDIPEVSLDDEAHAAFAATLPALTVSDTACAQVAAVAAAFTDGVSDAINNASQAASDINAASKAKAFALNAASKAAFAKFEFDYNTTSAATKAAAGACLYSRSAVPLSCYSRSAVPPRCTHLLYSTSLRMPICRILNPNPYVSTHALEKEMRGGDPSTLRRTSVSAQGSAVASSRESTLHRQDPQTMGHGILQTPPHPFSSQIRCRPR